MLYVYSVNNRNGYYSLFHFYSDRSNISNKQENTTNAIFTRSRSDKTMLSADLWSVDNATVMESPSINRRSNGFCKLNTILLSSSCLSNSFADSKSLPLTFAVETFKSSQNNIIFLLSSAPYTNPREMHL